MKTAGSHGDGDTGGAGQAKTAPSQAAGCAGRMSGPSPDVKYPNQCLVFPSLASPHNCSAEPWKSGSMREDGSGDERALIGRPAMVCVCV